MVCMGHCGAALEMLGGVEADPTSHVQVAFLRRLGRLEVVACQSSTGAAELPHSDVTVTPAAALLTLVQRTLLLPTTWKDALAKVIDVSPEGDRSFYVATDGRGSTPSLTHVWYVDVTHLDATALPVPGTADATVCGLQFAWVPAQSVQPLHGEDLGRYQRAFDEVIRTPVTCPLPVR